MLAVERGLVSLSPENGLDGGTVDAVDSGRWEYVCASYVGSGEERR